ncbi:MAG: hypothetical protein QG652_786 [Pseudomonadota bacterium]|nr:hypothetical protein [Pseudomonadota bacterium]
MFSNSNHSHRIIDLTIITLVLFILGLTADATWTSYNEYRAAGEMDQVNSMADHLLAASNLAAAERGITSSALGANSTIDPKTLAKMAETRKSGDMLWSGAMTTARQLAQRLPNNSEFVASIQIAEQDYTALQQIRQQVDDCLARKPCQTTSTAWLKQITQFILVSSRLREQVFTPLDSPRHVAQFNTLLKRWVWLASEHTGRERGTLAYYINAGKPLPPHILDEMKANWGVVERNIQDIQSVAELKNADPRIAQAVQVMEQNFRADYARVREQIYREAVTGRYSIDGLQWFDISTEAIGKMLKVASAVSEVTDEYAKQNLRDSFFHIMRHSLLLLVTFAMAGWSLTKVRQTAAQLFKQKELAEVTLHSIGDAVITTDANAMVEYINPIAEDITGWKNSEARGRPITEVCRLVNGLSGETEDNPVERCLRDKQVVGLAGNVVLKSRNGSDYVIEDSAAPIRDRSGNIVGAVMVFYDVTQNRSDGTHLLSYHATHDSLTNLVNRREFERRLHSLLELARKQDLRHAFCYLDLDQFKVINDTCGHVVGDKLLRQLAYLLQDGMRETDTLARLGGDEFGLLLENCPMDRALRIAEKIREIIKEFRFTWEGRSYELGVSIGLVQIDKNSVSIHELLREADAACYVAKEKGRNRVQEYRPDNLELAKRHGEMQWVSRINEALEQNRFRLYCQPIYSLTDMHECHLEILIRMIDEQGELITPFAFIPAAERYGLMPEIDRWVVRATMDALAIFRRDHDGKKMLCNINLSGASLGEEGFAAYLMEQIEYSRMPPESICFEITETAAVSNFEIASVMMKNLRKHGCRLALDDFGSGLSSFAYLKSFPVDFLKIDGSFVKHIGGDQVAYAMVQSINTVGHVMGIKTIAEYVEDQVIYDKLIELNVDYAQGYHMAKPMPLQEFLDNCY